MKSTLILLLIPSLTFGQSLKERLILTDKGDSALINKNAEGRFDVHGNYFFELKKGEHEYYAFTNKGTAGPFHFVGLSGGTNGLYTKWLIGSKEEDGFYYKNPGGMELYGPVKGRVESYTANNSRQNIILTVSRKDSVFFYVGNKLVGQRFRYKNEIGFLSDWCILSDNGNALYYVPRDSLYILYANGKAIDSSKHEFAGLSIADNGKFIYAKGERPAIKGKYDFMFYTHSADTTLGPVRTVWHSFVNLDGSYYHTGIDNRTIYYIVINDHLFRGIDSINHISLPGGRNFLFSFKEKARIKVNANGRVYSPGYPEIYCPAMDTAGNFSFYGIRDYYLYSYTNGREADKPLSQYGVRAIPIYISAKGSSVHYFRTDDSTYIYQDDRLLLTAFANSIPFTVSDKTSIIKNPAPWEKPIGLHHLNYLQIDSTGYFLYDGKLSLPIPGAKERSYWKEDISGTVLKGQLDENGFFVVYKTEKSSYTINVNNTVYKTLDGIDKLFEDDFFFDGRELIFYGRKGLSFYQFTLSL